MASPGAFGFQGGCSVQLCDASLDCWPVCFVCGVVVSRKSAPQKEGQSCTEVGCCRELFSEHFEVLPTHVSSLRSTLPHTEARHEVGQAQMHQTTGHETVGPADHLTLWPEMDECLWPDAHFCSRFWTGAGKRPPALSRNWAKHVLDLATECRASAHRLCAKGPCPLKVA